jgi:mannan polymerase II complex MNN10 subunit
MSLSRSPSPQPNGGWSTPGLADHSGRESPKRMPYDVNGYASNSISWAAAKAKSDQSRGYPSFSTRNEGFFSRSKRKISSTLPRFNSFGTNKKDWRESEKLGRGRWYLGGGGGGRWPRLKTFIGNVLRKFRFLFVVLTLIALLTFVMSKAREWSSVASTPQWKS